MERAAAEVECEPGDHRDVRGFDRACHLEERDRLADRGVAAEPPVTRTSALAAAPAMPATVATATASCGSRIAHSAQPRGPGSRAKPCKIVSPVHTVNRPISRLMNHFSTTAAICAHRRA